MNQSLRRFVIASLAMLLLALSSCSSCGRKGAPPSGKLIDYHHPHPKTMRLLSEKKDNVRTFRTDLEGTITATSDGNAIDIATEKQQARDRLYLTGDEVAGNVRGARGSEQRRSHSRRSK